MELNITRILSAAQSADISETMNNTSPFGERMLLALEITILGLFTVFAVLSIIWGVLSLMRLFMYDIPNRRKAKKESGDPGPESPSVQDTVAEAGPAASREGPDDAELVSAITAAICAYTGKDPGGFRVVSFRRKGRLRWDRS